MINEEALDNLVICKKCHTLHKKVSLNLNEKAFCLECNVLLYQNDPKMLDKALALVITAGISLFIAFEFSIMRIDIQGLEQTLTLSSFFSILAEHQQYVIEILFLFLLVLFPVGILLATFVLIVFMKAQKGGYLTKRLLILLAHLKPWNMVDIFFISLLVAMVKLFDVASIELGIGFMALILTLILDVIISKNLAFGELWTLHTQIYGVSDV